MPRLDGTGPRGQGPRTGRGLGNCQGIAGQFCPFANNVKTLSKEEQKKLLMEEKEMIEKELSDLEK